MSQVIIFDLDGTLVDSAPDLHAAVNRFLSELGKPALSLAQVTGFIGHGIPHLLQQVAEASQIEMSQKHLARYLDIYASDPVSHGALYPGVAEVLAELKQTYKLGICTNKAAAMTELVVQGYGLDQWISTVVSGDSLPVKKPDPAPLFACAEQMGTTDFIYIGDSETDAATAQNAKVPFVLFTEGYRSAPVEDLPTDAVFSRWDELPKLIQTLDC